MIRTLAWKDYREQRAVWLVIALAGAALLFALRELMGPGYIGSQTRLDGLLGGIGLAVAFTYGVVCGAMLLAGESETRTLPFLDYLEGQRFRIWTTKVLLGVLLTLAQSALLALVTCRLQTHWPPHLLDWFVVTPVFGLAGLAWGLLGSAFARSVLAAVAVAVGLLFVAVVLVMLIIGLFSRSWHTPDLPLMIGTAIFTLATLPGSALIFCRTDGQRRSAYPGSAGKVRRRPLSGARTILWLTIRQGRVIMLVLAGAALILGEFVPSHTLLLWPLVTLLLGVSCGMAVFAGEQASEEKRFLGDQRLPLGRILTIKTILWLVVALALTAIAALAAVIQIGTGTVNRNIPENESLLVWLLAPDWGRRELLLHIGEWTWLTFGLAYGFALGQFFTLLVRKTAVALVLALVVGVSLAGLWLPSLVNGGVYLWQVLLVPALLFVGIRPIVWAWASGRLYSLRPLLAFGGAGVLALASIAGTLWLRVVMIPDVGEPFDVKAFVASLPTPEENRAGRMVPAAVRDLEQFVKQVNAEFPVSAKGARPGDAAEPVPERQRPGLFSDEIWKIPENGWPKGQPELGRWLDRMFEGHWVEEFREISRLPPGMVVNLHTANSGTNLDHVQACRFAGALFTARALQMQARNAPKHGLDHLEVTLGLSRQLMHKAVYSSYLAGLGVQGEALAGMEHWLGALGPRPELLRPALGILNRHEAHLPPLTEVIKAQYLVMRNDRDNAASILVGMKATRYPSELALFGLASEVPWEEERDNRIMRFLAARALQAVERPLWDKSATPNVLTIKDHEVPVYIEPIGWHLGQRVVSQARWAFAQALCRLRATRLVTALALYEVDKGTPAQKLADLQPKYLDSLPVDPFSGEGFHYRISTGEKIERCNADGAMESIPIVAGRGILWSVGPDQVDNGGTVDGAHFDGGYGWGTNLDYIFLVPRWAGKERQKGAK
jgi:hypothetical protein